jgi:hypothetical protein
MPSQPSKRPPTIREQVVAHFTRGPGREAFEKALQTLVADPATSAPVKKRAQRTLEQLRAGR